MPDDAVAFSGSDGTHGPPLLPESPPDGPLGPRLYDNYSEQLTKGLDSCLGPNRRLRPNTVDEMRTLLGIEAGALELPPAAGASVSRIVLPVEPPAASAPADVRADDSASVHAEPSIEPAPQEITAPLTVVERAQTRETCESAK